MSGKRKKGKANIHVRLHRWVMNTPAWQSLKVGPKALLVELYNKYDGSNNGAVFLSIRDAANHLHASPNTTADWFDMLIETGFIKVSRRGAFSLKQRHATSWTLTEYALGEETPTKEFARWRPAEGAKLTSRRGGYRWGVRNTRIQRPVSDIDTDGIKHCVNNADPSTEKHPSRSQTLTPSGPDLFRHGVKHCDTGSVPRGVSSQNSGNEQHNGEQAEQTARIGASPQDGKKIAVSPPPPRLATPRKRGTGRDWTDGEIDSLQAWLRAKALGHARHLPLKLLASGLDRSEQSVRLKMHRLRKDERRAQRNADRRQT
jgi:hypothetical protein